MMATIVLLAFSLNVSAYETLKKVAVKVSAYTLTEVNQNKGKTASGKQLKAGYIAVSRDLEREHGLKFGDKVFISGIGEFEIQDRTSFRKKNSVDIYMISYEKAKQFGLKRLKMLITKPQNSDVTRLT
jgi:3D (Asp-Asp-Asp) domain-containing protein